MLLKRQQGFTLISLVFVLGFVAFLVLLILKIGPVYMDHSKITGALTSLEKTDDIGTMTEMEIRRGLDKRFNVDSVSDVTQEDITVIKSGEYLKVVIAYDVVKKLVGNVSLLVEFNDFIEVGRE
jgi:hypothetical protein